MRDDAEGRAGPDTAVSAAGSCLRIDLVQHDTTAVVFLAGELDLDSAPRLRAALERLVARGDRDIVVDVAGLRFCGAIGMGILVTTAQNLPSGGLLTLTGAAGMLRRLLHVTGVDEVVRLEPAAVSR
jgi:anti-sigma B factor antagonist